MSLQIANYLLLLDSLLSSNTPRLYTRLTEFLLTHSPAVPCLLYDRVNSLMNVRGVVYIHYRCLYILFKIILIVLFVKFLFTCNL